MQCKFPELINGLSSLSYTDRSNELSLEMLELQRLKLEFVTWFKILNGDVEVDTSTLFTFSNNCNTNGLKYKDSQAVSVCCIDACKYSFANRIFTVWNNLAACMVETVTVNIS